MAALALPARAPPPRPRATALRAAPAPAGGVHDGDRGSGAALLMTEKAFLRLLAAATAGGDVQALAIVDIDHFRPLRNVYGAAAAESLSRALAERLDGLARACFGRMVRLGADEFAVVVPAQNCQPSVIDWVHAAAAPFPFSYRTASLAFTMSAGLSLYSGRGKTAAEALRCARQAVTQAKQAGGGGMATCSAQQLKAVRGRGELALYLPRVIAEGQMVPFYQPVVSLKTNQVTGMEVLARWFHPKLGVLEPAAFIQLVEEHRLCSALTKALLHRVRVEAQSWPSHWTFAFNTSPNELPAVLDFIDMAERMDNNTIHGTRIELEVTETALMQDLPLARRAVTAMQPYGVNVVLDDFGSGYANFNQLCQVPFSRLKIDKSLITHLLTDKRVQACSQAIIDLAHQLGMTATAEGVESAALAKRLAEMGCDHAQGFHYGRPMPAEEVVRLAGDGATESMVWAA